MLTSRQIQTFPIGITKGSIYTRYLDEKTNDECKAEFRLNRKDVYKLAEQLQLPDKKKKKD